MREAGGHPPLVEVFVLSQLLALFQRDRYTRLRLNEQVVLGKKTGEQHAVPLLVRAFVHQAIDGLSSRTRIQPVAELASMRTQPPAPRTLLGTHVSVGLAVVHGERFQRRTGTGFRHVPRVCYSSLELPSQAR